MSSTKSKYFLCFCGLIFMATVAGSIFCGLELSNPNLTVERGLYLRRLIYFHFALSQLSVLAGLYFLYLTYFRARRSNLIVSYNEQGLHLMPPGIKLRAHTTYQCCLGKMGEAILPPTNRPIIVYPLMMQSGYSSGERLEEELRSAYAAKGLQPSFFIQPVLGANPWLVEASVSLLREHVQADCAILVIAHGTAPTQATAPEPGLFCRRLHKHLPQTNIVLYLFGDAQGALELMRQQPEKRILLLPFLLTEGVHYHRDLPTIEQARELGKELVTLPVLGKLLCLQDQEK